MAEKIVNKDVNYVGLKPRTVKNFYAIGTNSKGESFLTVIENATKLQAKNEGMQWAKVNDLTFEGVYSN